MTTEQRQARNIRKKECKKVEIAYKKACKKYVSIPKSKSIKKLDKQIKTVEKLIEQENL